MICWYFFSGCVGIFQDTNKNTNKWVRGTGAFWDYAGEDKREKVKPHKVLGTLWGFLRF